MSGNTPGRGSGRGGGFHGPSIPRVEGPIRPGTFRRALGLFRPYRSQLAVVMGLVLIIAALGIVTPLLIREVIDDAIPNGDRTLLGWLVGIMIAVTVFSGFFNMAEVWLNVGVGVRVMRDIREAVYAHLQKQPLQFFTSTRTGDVQSRLSNDIAATQSVVTDTIAAMVSNSATVLSSVVAMLIISWELSIAALVLVPFFVALTVYVGRVRRRFTRETQESMANLTAITGETLSVSGVLLAKTYGRERDHREEFESTNERLMWLTRRQVLTGRAFFVIVQTFFSIAPAAVWYLGGTLVTGDNPSVTIGDIVAFTVLQARLLFPLAQMLNRTVEISGSLALFDRVFEYLDLDPEITDPENPTRIDPATTPGRVAFKSVGFQYRSDAAPDAFSLNDVSFTAEPGRLTAIVGPSGSGKTTVGYLLSRLYDVDAGAVSIDGVDVRQMTLENLNSMIGSVSQDPFLFHTSVAENIKYGKPDASDEEMIEAAKAAQIHDTIAALADGYDTVVGERGYRMSGGERQRIAIARVTLANPRILLLDEATSSLDTLSERMIQRALSGAMIGRTTIAIAHRLSTIMAADLILVLDGGRIVESGRHHELLAQSGLYRLLYKEQFLAAPPTPESSTAASG
ncbi:MAG: ABC transporter ATP-binding protein [Chloroflexi bacterium]|nr:ABC transporter ATP-binding protein [Chloroflexota bacterium]